MNTVVLIWTIIMGIISPLFCFLRIRRHVLYWFVLFAIFTPVIHGYMQELNLFIGGYAVSVLDLMLIYLLILAYPIARSSLASKQWSGVDVCVFILTLLLFMNLAIGILRLGTFTGVANVFRRCMFIPVYFVASAILSSPEEVKKFYRAVMWFVLFVFIIHLGIAFKIYLPPLGESLIERLESLRQSRLARSTLFIYEPFYLISAAIAVCHLLYSKKNRLLSYGVLICSALGALLTQSRTIYGGLFLLLLGIVGIAKGKVRLSLVILLVMGGMFISLMIVEKMGVEIFSRFREERAYSELEVAYGQGSVRFEEWLSYVEALKRAPMSFFTGQGFGIEHQFRGRQEPRTYFHNDYLGTLFYFGLIGLLCYLIIVWGGVFRGRHYCSNREMALLIMPTRLILFVMAGTALLSQQFWLNRGTALAMTIVAISGNISYLVQQVYMQQESQMNFCMDLAESAESV